MQKNGAKPKFCAEKSQNVVSVACKPSSVIGGHLSRPIVTDGFKRNPESIDGPSQALFRFLLRAGFTSRTSRQAAGELLPHLSTLTRQACGISLLHFPWGRPRRPLAVILALWSSDFPQAGPFERCPQLFSLLAEIHFTGILPGSQGTQMVWSEIRRVFSFQRL